MEAEPYLEPEPYLKNELGPAELPLPAPIFSPPSNFVTDVLSSSAPDTKDPAEPTVAASEQVAYPIGESTDAAPPTAELPTAPRFFPLDRRSIRVEQVTGLAIFGILSIASLVGLMISYFSVNEVNWIWWTVAAGIIAGACLLLGFVLLWPSIEYRHARWAWGEDGLEIHRGVFWRHKISIPISRIQHVDVSQGPLQRQFGLGKVTVHTAGTRHAAIELSGIAYEAATWLREQIIAGQGVQDAV